MIILQGGDDRHNRLGLRLLDMDKDFRTEGFKDPWGRHYMVDFAKHKGADESEYYECVVNLPNRNRYIFEDPKYFMPRD